MVRACLERAMPSLRAVISYVRAAMKEAASRVPEGKAAVGMLRARRDLAAWLLLALGGGAEGLDFLELGGGGAVGGCFRLFLPV